MTPASSKITIPRRLGTPFWDLTDGWTTTQPGGMGVKNIFDVPGRARHNRIFLGAKLGFPRSRDQGGACADADRYRQHCSLRGTFEPSRHGAAGPASRSPRAIRMPRPRGYAVATGRLALCHRACAQGRLKRIDRGMLLIWIEAEDRHRTAMTMQAKLDETRAQLLIRGPLGWRQPL